TTQGAYEEAIGPLFDTLDWLESRLATRRFLMGRELTEADIRLFATLIRFDAVYVGHFKCNNRRIALVGANLGWHAGEGQSPCGDLTPAPGLQWVDEYP
ncbi:glutathione S-transferase C-terminal domain-containing protein, partial [Mycobacterium tuberculosis]|nr:glutathione S-transferase C-terminal domain-containing protein [Mycobacterium tuberculosis]